MGGRSLSAAALCITGGTTTLSPTTLSSEMLAKGATAKKNLSSSAGFAVSPSSPTSRSGLAVGSPRSFKQQRRLVLEDGQANAGHIEVQPNAGLTSTGLVSLPDSVFTLEVSVTKALTGEPLALLRNGKLSWTISDVIGRLTAVAPLQAGQRYRLTYGGCTLELERTLDAVVRSALSHRLELQAVIKDKRSVESAEAAQGLEEIARLPRHHATESVAMVSPPWCMLRIVELVSIVLDVKPDRVRDPDSKRLLDNYWPPAQRTWLTLSPHALAEKLADIDLEDFNARRIGKILQHLDHDETDPEHVARVSLFMSKLAVWCHAFGRYVQSTG